MKKKKKKKMLTYLNAGQTPQSPTEGTETSRSQLILTNQLSPIGANVIAKNRISKHFVILQGLEGDP